MLVKWLVEANGEGVCHGASKQRKTTQRNMIMGDVCRVFVSPSPSYIHNKKCTYVFRDSYSKPDISIQDREKVCMRESNIKVSKNIVVSDTLKERLVFQVTYEARRRGYRVHVIY